MHTPAFTISTAEGAAGISRGGATGSETQVNGTTSLGQITYLLLIWGSDTYTSGAVRVHATYDPATYYSKHSIPYTTQTNPILMGTYFTVSLMRTREPYRSSSPSGSPGSRDSLVCTHQYVGSQRQRMREPVLISSMCVTFSTIICAIWFPNK